MKRITRTFAFLALAGIGKLAMAQNVPSSQTPRPEGILGYLDPRTGSFRVLAKPPAAVTEATTAPTTGKFVFNITFNIQSAISTSTAITCTAIPSTYDAEAAINELEESSVTATRSGATGTCSITVPYSWILPDESSDVVTLGYSITSATRSVYHALPAISVPVNGATTTETVSTVF